MFAASRVTKCLAVLVLVAGCQSPGQRPEAHAAAVELTSVPFFAQSSDQCGPAALATVLKYSGVQTSLDDARESVYLPGRSGSVRPEIKAAIRRQGRVPYPVDGNLEALRTELEAGRPVLVFQNLGFRKLPIWHYAVLVGYDPGSDEVILRSGTRERQRMSSRRFLASWAGGDHWAYSVLRPGEIPSTAKSLTYLVAIAELESQGQLDAALRSYRAAAERWPDQSHAWLGIGNVHYYHGSLEQAKVAYQRALEADPSDFAAVNNLAQAVAELGCPDQAVEMLDRALTATGPRSSQLSETRGEVQAMGDELGECRAL